MTNTSSIPTRAFALLALGLFAMFVAGPSALASGNKSRKNDNACSTTARDARLACSHEVSDDFWIAAGNCENIADPDERSVCLHEARDALRESARECQEQHDARRDVCAKLGQATFEPEYHASDFVDPLAVGGPAVQPNPYLPLVPGTRYRYENEFDGETIIVSVTHETIEIDGVICILVRDVVTDSESGDLIEDTDDFLAQDTQGNVWYFGEVSREYEDGFLASLDGSWRAGVDDAHAGILMKAAPQVGDVYRQEFMLGEAEDVAEVTDLAGSAMSPYASCAGNCLVTSEYTPMSPGSIEHKYYKPGLGQVLVHDPETNSREVLVAVEIF